MNNYRPFEWDNVINEWKRANDWYQYLDVNPETVIERCIDAGVDISDTIEILNVWGKEMLEITKRSREPRPDEVPGIEIYNKDINPDEAFKSVYEYDRTVEKPAFEASLAECELGNVEAKEASLCRNLLCRADSQDPVTGKVIRNKILNLDDVDSVLADNPDKIAKYERCFEKNIRVCQGGSTGELDISDQYDPNYFTRFNTTGDGNCLFWAICRYINIARDLGSYPVYSVHADVPDKSVICTATTIEQVKQLRADAVKWLSDNRNSVYDILARPVGEELANDIIGQLRDVRNIKLETAYVKYLQLETVAHCEHIINNQRNNLCKQCTGLNFSKNEFQKARTMLIDALVDRYAERMTTDGIYGGQHEIYALSKLLQTDIIVMQTVNDTFLTSNMGFTGGYDRTLYIIHTLDIGAVHGGLHYETLFALPYTKFACKLPDYEINDVATEVDDGMPLYNVANRNMYDELFSNYILTGTRTSKKEAIFKALLKKAKNPETRRLISMWLAKPQTLSINNAILTMIRMYNSSVDPENYATLKEEETGDAALYNMAVVTYLLDYIDENMPEARDIGMSTLQTVFDYNAESLQEHYNIDFANEPKTLSNLFKILTTISGDGNFMI